MSESGSHHSGGSRNTPAHVPLLRVPILSFWHTNFTKRSCIGSCPPPQRGWRPSYGESWICHWTILCFLYWPAIEDTFRSTASTFASYFSCIFSWCSIWLTFCWRRSNWSWTESPLDTANKLHNMGKRHKFLISLFALNMSEVLGNGYQNKRW